MKVKKFLPVLAAFVLAFLLVLYYRYRQDDRINQEDDSISQEYSSECITAVVQGTGECSVSREQLSGYNTYDVRPGALINAQLVIYDTPGIGLDTICLRNQIGDLEYVSAEGRGNYAYSEKGSKFVEYLRSLAEAVEMNGETLITYNLRVPENASPGEIFKVEWTDESTYAFCFANTWKGEQNLPREMIPAAFVVIS